MCWVVNATGCISVKPYTWPLSLRGRGFLCRSVVNLTMKKIRQLLHCCQSYCENNSGLLFETRGTHRSCSNCNQETTKLHQLLWQVSPPTCISHYEALFSVWITVSTSVLYMLRATDRCVRSVDRAALLVVAHLHNKIDRACPLLVRGIKRVVHWQPRSNWCMLPKLQRTAELSSSLQTAFVSSHPAYLVMAERMEEHKMT